MAGTAKGKSNPTENKVKEYNIIPRKQERQSKFTLLLSQWTTTVLLDTQTLHRAF